MIVSGLILTAQAFVLNFYSRIHWRPMPRWLKTIAFKWLAKILGIDPTIDEHFYKKPPPILNMSPTFWHPRNKEVKAPKPGTVDYLRWYKNKKRSHRLEHAEWFMLGFIFDRLFFIVFVIIVFVSNFVLLFWLPYWHAIHAISKEFHD